MPFTHRHVNRLHFPEHDVLICEDDIVHQRELMERMEKIFSRQGKWQIHLTSSGSVAAAILQQLRDRVKLIILDHDLPVGNASDLLTWMNTEIVPPPVITASGIPQNNTHMKKLCDEYGIVCHEFDKFQVIDGKADDLIKKLVLNV